MSDPKQKVKLRDRMNSSSNGDLLTRAFNALGSAGLGFIIGALLFSWLPGPQIVKSAIGAAMLAGILDYMYKVWVDREEIAESSDEQLIISGRAASISLYASTFGTAAFFLYQMAPFFLSVEWQAANMPIIRGVLSLLVTSSLVYQMIENSRWQRADPDRQRDRQRATYYAEQKDSELQQEGLALQDATTMANQLAGLFMNAASYQMAVQRAQVMLRNLGYSGPMNYPTAQQIADQVARNNGEAITPQQMAQLMADQLPAAPQLQAAPAPQRSRTDYPVPPYTVPQPSTNGVPAPNGHGG